MRSVFGSVLVLAVMSGAAFSAGTSPQMQKFILGVELLSENTTLTDQQRGAAYNRLKQLTGIDAHEAVVFVQSFRDRPEKWQKLQEKLTKLAESSFASPKPPVTADSIATDSAGKPAATPASERKHRNSKG